MCHDFSVIAPGVLFFFLPVPVSLGRVRVLDGCRATFPRDLMYVCLFVCKKALAVRAHFSMGRPINNHSNDVVLNNVVTGPLVFDFFSLCTGMM
jgi:hypothetical protein